MTFRVLAIWCSVSVALQASGQVRMQWNDEEQAFFNKIRTTLDKAIPEIDGSSPSDRIFERTSFPDSNGFDITNPFTCYYRTQFASANGKYANLFLFVNPKNEAIAFDVTRDFEVLDIDGVCHGVRGNQRFEQTSSSNRYTDPFTALFVGRFTLPYNARYPNRAGGCWGPQQFVTTTTYTAYDISKHYLDVQGMYILIQGDPELADKIIEKIDFAALNGLIVK